MQSNRQIQQYGRDLPEQEDELHCQYVEFLRRLGIEHHRIAGIYPPELRGYASFANREVELVCDNLRNRWVLLRSIPLATAGTALAMVLAVLQGPNALVPVMIATAIAVSLQLCYIRHPQLHELLQVNDRQLEPFNAALRDICFRLLHDERLATDRTMLQFISRPAAKLRISCRIIDQFLRDCEEGKGPQPNDESTSQLKPQLQAILPKLAVLKLLTELLHEDEAIEAK